MRTPRVRASLDVGQAMPKMATLEGLDVGVHLEGQGLGFGVWGLAFGVWGLGFGVWGLGFVVWGLGFRV